MTEYVNIHDVPIGTMGIRKTGYSEFVVVKRTARYTCLKYVSSGMLVKEPVNKDILMVTRFVPPTPKRKIYYYGSHRSGYKVGKASNGMCIVEDSLSGALSKVYECDIKEKKDKTNLVMFTARDNTEQTIKYEVDNVTNFRQGDYYIEGSSVYRILKLVSIIESSVSSGTYPRFSGVKLNTE